MPHLADLAFPTQSGPDHRYYTDNHMYGPGDALIYAGLIRHIRPRRLIEVGSGFSSAMLLDVLDRSPDLATQLTFIEPYADRNETLLRPAILDNPGGGLWLHKRA